jgi:hypothetical protein
VGIFEEEVLIILKNEKKITFFPKPERENLDEVT